MNRDRTLTCVVTFEPDDACLAHLAALRGEARSLLVVDNSFTRQAIARVARTCEAAGAHVLQNRRNLGQAEALNQGCSWAEAQGYECILFFDQDTKVKRGFFEHYFEQASALPGDLSKVVVGCQYLAVRDRMVPRLAVSRKRTVITSGSLVPLSLWRRVGPFRSDYFIDHVDDEFSLRVRRAGGTIWRINDPLIDHQIGNAAGAGGWNHSAFRWYHMVRNHLWTLREYWAFDPVWGAYTTALKLKLALGALLHEGARAEKARAMLRGARDGLLKRPKSAE
jgi:rhamnosyltransferase